MLRLLPFLFLVYAILPLSAFAQGIVPCGGEGQPACQGCHVVQLVDNLIGWLVGFLAVLAIIVFVVAGIKLVTSGGNVSAKEQAKSMFTNVVIGIIIVLSAWLIIDTIMKSLLKVETKAGFWNSVLCVDQPDFMNPTPGQSRGTASGLSAKVPTNSEYEALKIRGGSYKEQICAHTADAGIPEECESVLALMLIESSGCRNKVSDAGAYGCMQILPTTAAQYDPQRLSGKTHSEIAQILRDDDAYNIALGTRIYADLHKEYNGNPDLIYAAYNGGKGANLPSRDCDGMLRWQCGYDNRDHTIVNTGYQETRNYVENVATLRDKLKASGGE